jgi:hypothetical protein
MSPIHCPFGLGNRVAAMANGLSRWGTITFRWPVNKHCPATAADMFPTGVPGVDFLPGPERPEFATRWGGTMAHCWDACGDRERANAAYATIMASMVGTAAAGAPRTAVLGRFHRNPAADPAWFAEEIPRNFHGQRSGRIFLLCDLHRDLISRRLSRAGFDVMRPVCGSLADDMERSRADVMDYASDWATLLAAARIIALDGPASALNPARAAGIRIIYAAIKS